MSSRFPVRVLTVSVLLTLTTILDGCSSGGEIEATEGVHRDQIISPPYIPSDYISFRAVGVNEGLPENTARQFVIDLDSRLWVVTQNGLGRFENNRFKPYVSSEKDSNTVFINSLWFEKSINGQLMTVSVRGVSVYDDKLDRFERHSNPQFEENSRQGPHLDSKGNLWIHEPEYEQAKLSLVRGDEIIEFEERYNGVNELIWEETADGTLYNFMASTEERLIVRIDASDLDNVDIKTLMKDSVPTFHPLPLLSGLDGHTYKFDKNKIICWMGQDNFYIVEGDNLEKKKIPLPRGQEIQEASFQMNFHETALYLVVNYFDGSSAVFSLDFDFNNLKKCFDMKDRIAMASVNSVGDFTCIRDLSTYKEGKALLVNYSKQDRTVSYVQSNMAEHVDFQMGRIIAMSYDHTDNLWLGTWNYGALVYTPQDQGFRKNSGFLGQEEHDDQLYYPIHSNLDKNYIISENGALFINKRQEADSSFVTENTNILSVQKFDDLVAIGAGRAGVLIFDTRTEKLSRIDVNSYPGNQFQFYTRAAYIDSKNRLWGVCANGVYSVQLTDGKADPHSLEIYRQDVRGGAVFLSNRAEGIIDIDGQIYLFVQGPDELLMLNEQAEKFEIFEGGEKIMGRHFLWNGESLWFSSFYSGLTEMDPETMEVIRNFSRENEKLPTSWISSCLFLGSEQILFRGEVNQWYTFNLSTEECHPFNQYQEFEQRLMAYDPVYNENSQQLLPGTNCIYEYDINFIDEIERHQLEFTGLKVNRENVANKLPYKMSMIGSVTLPYDQNNLQIQFADFAPQESNRIFYEFTLDGHDNKWRSNEEMKANYPGLPPGDYTFKVRMTSRADDNSSTPIELKIRILKPWYLTTLAMVIYFIGLIALIFSIVRARTRKLRMRQLQLERVIAEKTLDIRLQKEDIEEKQREILDSIAYAKRIQSAILPQEDLWNEHLPQSFVLYMPKDIVAGDFYWMHQEGDVTFFAAADCTGHGVPGAMVSVICNNSLNKAVSEYDLTDPGEILEKTRDLVVAEFEKSDEGVRDGMDIALCRLDGTELSYAGAHNPLWIIRKDGNEIEEFKADKQPIGVHVSNNQFTTHKIDLQKGDIIYIFSDGFADQFGGTKGKKYKASNFKKLLISIKDQPIENQKYLLTDAFTTWRGDLEQLDDLCIIGVRI